MELQFNDSSTPLVPDNLIGVYSFVVEPGIANHDLGYLLYIGKTDKQDFRARFKQYLGLSEGVAVEADSCPVHASGVARAPEVLLRPCGQSWRREGHGGRAVGGVQAPRSPRFPRIYAASGVADAPSWRLNDGRTCQLPSHSKPPG